MLLADRQQTFQKLKDLVDEKGITIYRLAKDTGISATVFSDWKSGKSVPKVDKLVKIAEYLGVGIEYFI